MDPNLLSAFNDVTFLFTLTVKSSLLRLGLFGLFVYINIQRIFFSPLQLDAYIANALGCACVIEVLRVLDALYLSDLRLVGQDAPRDSLPLWSRIKWAVQLKLALRGIGWQHAPMHTIPPAPVEESRSAFVIRCVLGAVWGILCTDLVGLTILYQPPNNIGHVGLQFWHYFRYILQIYGISYFGMNTAYYIFGILLVPMGFTSPQDWPPLFGPLSGAYTVKRFWGRIWHQTLRKPITAPWGVIAKRLGIKPGTKANYYLTLYGAFFLSSLAHQAGAYTASHVPGANCIYLFFCQAVAITIEDIIFNITKWYGIKGADEKRFPWWRWFGYLWVCGWLALSPPMYRGKIAEDIPFGWWRLSPILGVYRGEWFPTVNTRL